jgi:hypothetical protein
MGKPNEDVVLPVQVLGELLAFSANQSDRGRAFARHMEMRPTDATAIVEILRAEERGQPLTPARLGERIGMTSGHADRRIVTLHSAAAVHAEATAFFEPERERLVELLRQFGPDELALIHRFTSELAIPTSPLTAPG